MRIAVTGGSGRIGRALRAEFAGRFERLRVVDMVRPADLRAGEDYAEADLADGAAAREALRGVDGIVHLAGNAGNGGNATFADVLPANMAATWNVYDAARANGVARVVFGGSNHALGFLPRGMKADERAPLRPDSPYGLSKAFGELVASLYWDKFGVRSLVMRIGNAAALPPDVRSLSMWVSARDLAQLTLIGLEHPGITCDIVYGVSDNSLSFYDNARAHALGYRPRDRADDHRAGALEGEKTRTASEVTRNFQGGGFADKDYVYPPRAPRP